ncbi:hypothetical protein ACT2FY_40790 [Paraburkholderia fungorum]|uniref:hypothetical protein n=1 Tax=Paraburkholderia fungorum TaxID=134537 RepID=UPI00402B0DD4
MRAERQHILFFVATSTQRDDLEAHAAGVLNRHVPKATYAQHRNLIASLRARLLKSVEGGDACAEDRAASSEFSASGMATRPVALASIISA